MKPNPKSKKAKAEKPLALVITSEDAMRGLLNELCETQCLLAEQNAAHDMMITALNATHDDAVQPLRTRLAQLEASIQLFCVSHRETLFTDGKKSVEYSNAIVGFRDDPPAVGKLIKGDTDENIAERLSETEWGEIYMHWKAALDKKALLRDRETLTPQQLKLAGIRFDQEEKFFITPKAQTGERVTKDADQVAAA